MQKLDLSSLKKGDIAITWVNFNNKQEELIDNGTLCSSEEQSVPKPIFSLFNLKKWNQEVSNQEMPSQKQPEEIKVTEPSSIIDTKQDKDEILPILEEPIVTNDNITEPVLSENQEEDLLKLDSLEEIDTKESSSIIDIKKEEEFLDLNINETEETKKEFFSNLNVFDEFDSIDEFDNIDEPEKINEDKPLQDKIEPSKEENLSYDTIEKNSKNNNLLIINQKNNNDSENKNTDKEIISDAKNVTDKMNSIQYVEQVKNDLSKERRISGISFYFKKKIIIPGIVFIVFWCLIFSVLHFWLLNKGKTNVLEVQNKPILNIKENNIWEKQDSTSTNISKNYWYTEWVDYYININEKKNYVNAVYWKEIAELRKNIIEITAKIEQASDKDKISLTEELKQQKNKLREFLNKK